MSTFTRLLLNGTPSLVVSAFATNVCMSSRMFLPLMVVFDTYMAAAPGSRASICTDTLHADEPPQTPQSSTFDVQQMPCASSVPEQHCPSASMLVLEPLQTPHASTLPTLQHWPSASSWLPAVVGRAWQSKWAGPVRMQTIQLLGLSVEVMIIIHTCGQLHDLLCKRHTHGHATRRPVECVVPIACSLLLIMCC